MRKQTSASFLAVVTTLAITSALMGCQDKKLSEQSGMPPVPVSVATVISRPVQQWDEFNGRVVAVDSVEVRPRVTGHVQRVTFTEGAEVKRGDLLFVIDQRPYQAALDSALAQLERARATSELAQSQDHRAKTLFEASATSKEEAETRQAGYAQSRADVRAAEAAVANARLNLQFTEVRAPVNGRVSRALLTVGNLAVGDQSLLTSVVSQDPVHIYFDPDEHSYLRYSAQAHPVSGEHLDVRVGLVSEQGFPHAGTVDFIDNQVNPGTGTIHMRAVMRNPDRLFTPGLYARVQFADSRPTPALLIDDKAVMTDQDRRYVYVLSEDGKAIRRDVKPGRMADGLRVIDSGLNPGDKIIIDGLQRIFFSGATVKPTVVAMDASLAPTAASGTPVAATK